MTGYQSKKKATSAKTIDQVNWADHEPDGLVHTAQEPQTCKGRKCQASNENGFDHSPECIADTARDQGWSTAPPQRPWVGLTPEELNMIGDSMRTWNSWSITDVYTAIEAKLKEKNNG